MILERCSPKLKLGENEKGPELLFNSLRIRWQPRFNPRVVATVERMHIPPTAVRKFLRHTGARCFVRSSAIGNNGAVFRNFIEVLFKLFLGHPDRIRQFLI